MDQGTAAPVNDVGGSNQAQVIAQAVAAAVTASLSEITAKVNQMLQSVSENVKKQSATDDRGFDSAMAGSYNPFASLLKSEEGRDRISAYAEQALANCIQHSNDLARRSLDHYSALPPVAGKPQGC